MGFLRDLFLGKQENKQSDGFSVLFDNMANLTLKNIALETCANYVARSFSKGEIIIKENGKRQTEDLHYLLNVRPNPNQTASEFKSELAKRLITNGEVLVIKDKDSLYIANSFVTSYSVKGDVFTGVTLKNDNNAFVSKRYVQANNCFYLKNENEALNAYIDSLWSDYGQIFGSMIGSQIRSGQIRATFEMPSGNELNEKQRAIYDKMRKSVSEDVENGKSLVWIPTAPTAKYSESLSERLVPKSNIEDMNKMKQSYINDVADILGIPNALMHGDLANNAPNWDLFIETVLEPMGNKLTEALTHLYVKLSGLKSGRRIEIRGFKERDIFKLSESIDKLIGCGAFVADEIRRELGYEEIPGGDVRVMTKNYQKVGGKETDENIET